MGPRTSIPAMVLRCRLAARERWHAATEPSDRPLYIAPVAPVWQVWKPRALRGSWRRRSDYGTQRWRRAAMRTAFTLADSSAADDSAATSE